VVATGSQLVERGRLHAVLVGWAAGDRVEPDVGDLAAVVGPDVGAVVLADQPGGAVLEARLEAPVEQMRWLDHVVVDAHEDQVVDVDAAHVASSRIPDVSSPRRRVTITRPAAAPCRPCPCRCGAAAPPAARAGGA